MHASLSLLTGVLLLFSRHVLAAPSDNKGLQAAGVILHDMHHMDVYGRQIQKRQVGSLAQRKYLGDGTQSPAGVEAPEDDTQSPATPANEQVGLHGACEDRALGRGGTQTRRQNTREQTRQEGQGRPELHRG